MKTLLLAAILGWAAPGQDQVPGTEATDRGNPEATERRGDVLTPGTEKDLEREQREVQRAARTSELTRENIEATGSEDRPGLKPTGFLAAGLLVAVVGFTLGRRRRHRGRGMPPGPPNPPLGPKV